MSLSDLMPFSVTAPRHTWKWVYSHLPKCDASADILQQLETGVAHHPDGAAQKALADEVARLEGTVERLREALAEAVYNCDGGRVSQIGRSRVTTPQIDVRAIKRWRDALKSIDAERGA